MKIDGRVIRILEEQTGQGQRGEWRKQDFVVHIEGEYPKQICCTMWGDNIDKFALQVGDEVSVGINVKSREYKDRWYTDITAWRVEKKDGEFAPPQPPMAAEPGDGLPF